MANFVDCWGKLKSSRSAYALNDHDKQSILDRIGEHLKAGVEPHEAARLSVQFHLEDTRNQIESIYKEAGVERGAKGSTTQTRISGGLRIPSQAELSNAMEVLKSQPLNDEGEKVDKVAIRFPNGEVKTGTTHADVIASKYPVSNEVPYGQIQQGFTTTSGRFVNREEAFKLAAGHNENNRWRLTGEMLRGAIQTLRSQQTLDLFNDYAANLPARAKVSKPALKEQVAKDVPALSKDEAALSDLFKLAQDKLTNKQPTVPALRRGEKQGDLLSKQEEDLKLVGEKGIDYGARQSAKEESERALAEQDKNLQEKLTLGNKPQKMAGFIPTEGGGAPRILSNLPENVTIQFPSGKWGFVGRVDARLMYEQKDGSPATPEQINTALQHGPGLVKGIQRRTWDTEEAAKQAAADLSAQSLEEGKEDADTATTKTNRIRVGGGEHDTGGEGVSGELRPTKRGQLSKEHATGRVKEILGNKAPRSGWHESTEVGETAWMRGDTGEVFYNVQALAERHLVVSSIAGSIDAGDVATEAGIDEEIQHQKDRTATLNSGRKYGSLQEKAWLGAPSNIRNQVRSVYHGAENSVAYGAELIRMLAQIRANRDITESTLPWSKTGADLLQASLRGWTLPPWLDEHLQRMAAIEPQAGIEGTTPETPEKIQTTKGEEYAIRQPKAESIFQRQPSEIREAGGGRGRVEPSQQGQEVASPGEVRPEHLAAQPTRTGQVYFVRHGTTTFNAETGQSPDRIRGHINVPLNANGARQAVKAGKDLSGSGITKIYTSDLSRAANTAGHISAQLETKPTVVPLYGLRPWKLGTSIEGKPTTEVLPKIKQLVQNPDQRPEGGETFNEFKTRYLSTVDRIKADNPNENIAIVTHYRGLKLAKSIDVNGNVDINEFTSKDDTIPPGSFQVEQKSVVPAFKVGDQIVTSTGARIHADIKNIPEGEVPIPGFIDQAGNFKYKFSEDEPLSDQELRSQSLLDSEKTARQRFEENLPLANRIANTFGNIPGLERGDIQSKARTALLRASRAFDASRGIPFNRLAQVSIKNELRKLYGDQVSIPEETTLEAPLTAGGLTAKELIRAPTDVRSEVQHAEADRVLRGTIAELPERMQTALNGILDGQTFPEIAAGMGISKQGAQQLAVKAMERIRGKLGERGVARTSDLLSQPLSLIDQHIKEEIKSQSLSEDDPHKAFVDLMKSDLLDKLYQKAAAEQSPERTVGRPDLALGGYGPHIAAVHEFHTETTTPETFEKWNKQGEEILKRGDAQWGKDVVKRWLDGGFLEPGEVRAAQQAIIDNPGQFGMSAMYAFTRIGRAVSHMMSARRDPTMTPAERAKVFLAETLASVNPRQQAEIDGITDGQAKINRIEQLISSQRHQINLAIEMMSGKGVTIDDILSGGTELRLVGAKIIDTQMKDYSSAEQKALKLAQKGERTPAEIAKATGLTEKAVRDLNDAFISDLEKSLMPKTLAGATLENLDPMLLAQETVPGEGKVVSEEQARAEARKMIKAMGFVPSKELGNFKVAKRKRAQRIFVPPPKAGPPVEPPTPGELPYPYPAVPPYTGRVLGQMGLPLYQEMMTHKGGDLGNVDDVAKLSRIMQAAKGNRFDMLFEIGLNNLLSNPTTHFAYKLAILANTAWQGTIQTGMESMVNLLVRDPNSASFKEFNYIARGIKPGLTSALRLGARQWSTESELFDQEFLNGQAEMFDSPGEKFTKGGPKVSEAPIEQFFGPSARPVERQLQRLGKFNPVRGRVIRMPRRMLFFIDGFYKALNAHMWVGQFASRIAQTEGLKGDELTKRIAYLVSQPGSEAWQRAATLGEWVSARSQIPSREQQREAEPSTLRRFTKSQIPLEGVLDHAVSRIAKARSESYLIGMQLPFVQLPYNLVKIATGKFLSPIYTPIKAGAATVGALPFRYDPEQGFYTLKDGKTFSNRFWSNYPGQNFTRDVASALITTALGYLFWNAIAGDGDDDDKKVLITGSLPFTEVRRGQRELQKRAYGGPFVLRIGGRNGVHINYGKYEPAATILGALADTIIQMKRTIRGQESWRDALDSVGAYYASQAEEKSFIRNIGNLMRVVEGEMTWSNYVKQQMVSWLTPGLLRAPLRNINDYVPDTRQATLSQLITGQGLQPRVDIYGEPIKKTGNWFSRMFFLPAEKPTEHLQNADRLLLRWNNTHPQQARAPEEPRLYRQDPDNPSGKQIKMTPEEGTKFLQAAGRRFAASLRGQITEHNVQHPTEADVKRIMNLHTKATEEVRREMFPKTAPRKVSQVNHVREMMRAA